MIGGLRISLGPGRIWKWPAEVDIKPPVKDSCCEPEVTATEPDEQDDDATAAKKAK